MFLLKKSYSDRQFYDFLVEPSKFLKVSNPRLADRQFEIC